MLRQTTTTHRFMYQKCNKYEIINKKQKQTKPSSQKPKANNQRKLKKEGVQLDFSNLFPNISINHKTKYFYTSTCNRPIERRATKDRGIQGCSVESGLEYTIYYIYQMANDPQSSCANTKKNKQQRVVIYFPLQLQTQLINMQIQMLQWPNHTAHRQQ